LSHVSSLFCSAYFGDRASLSIGWLEPQHSYVTLPAGAGMTGVQHHTSCWLRWGLTNYLLRLASNHDFNLSLPSS
jgi:hypothetical protein